MTDLNQTLLQKASGETRLNPDQQRYYLGTFRERVVLTVSFEEGTSPLFSDHFSQLCLILANDYNPLFLKISPQLPDNLQISFMKTAQEHGISVTIVDESSAASPFALLFHTDHAIDKEDIHLTESFPDFLKPALSENTKKKGFWQTIFGG